MELVIQPLGRTITVSAGADLSAMLREHNVSVSYSCMAGRCSTCRCKAIDGKILESGRKEKITSPNDSGYVPACVSVLNGICTIEIAEPDEVAQHPARIIKATVTAIEDMTHDIKRLRLRPNKPLSFSPGQYSMLEFTAAHMRPGLSEDEASPISVGKPGSGLSCPDLQTSKAKQARAVRENQYAHIRPRQQ
jgi:ferredoxin-NAD(P)+ reductase (naphthalene dioxygenase ferredoxin-specific)